LAWDLVRYGTPAVTLARDVNRDSPTRSPRVSGVAAGRVTTGPCLA